MSEQVLLQAAGLCKYYHSGGSDIAALDHVYFQLEKGGNSGTEIQGQYIISLLLSKFKPTFPLWHVWQE